MIFTTSKKVYEEILAEINRLFFTFDKSVDDELIQVAQEEAKKQLSVSLEEIKESLEQLEKNTEWDVFTIAFYGETNAGKSTIIETLRILLKEPLKMKERQEFHQSKIELDKIQQFIRENEDKVQSIADRYAGEIKKIENQILNLSEQFQRNTEEILSLKKKIEESRFAIKSERKASIVNFLRCFFNKHPLQKKIKEFESYISIMENEDQKIIQLQKELKLSKEKQGEEKEQEIKDLTFETEQLKRKAENYKSKMLMNADGNIIGNGSSDFTREVGCYTFEVNNQKFALLDLPGIEGNEKLVIDNINAAVQKAHVVFYIKSDPNPPQTGDNKIGTLEKIKAHLGQHTEVFSIFNKRVKNHNSLKEQLVNEGEAGSLKVLDKIMREHLGKQYTHCISLSAYPAYLAVAECFSIESELKAKKTKFIKHFHSSELLLEKTHVKSFSEWLTTDIVNNCKTKIKKSNFNKAVNVLSSTTEKIKQINKKFVTIHQELLKSESTTLKQIGSSAEELRKRLEADSNTLVKKFKEDLRKEIYNDIEKGIGGNVFEAKMKQYVKERTDCLHNELQDSIKKQINEFERSISEILKKYEEYAKELLSIHEHINDFNKNFEIKIRTKRGISLVGLPSSLVGAGLSLKLAYGAILAAYLNPVTLTIATAVVLVIGAIGAIIGVWKSARNLFDKEYRKGQQRKAADENIDKIGKGILKSIKRNLAEGDIKLQAATRDIKNEVKKLANHIDMINCNLENAKSKLIHFTLIIKTEGEN